MKEYIDKRIKDFQRKIESSYLVFLFVCICFVLFLLPRSLDDPDLLWHIKLGEEIVANKAVSLYDTFSWQPGLVWYQQEWLFDVFIYLVSLPFNGGLFELLFILNNTLIFFLGYLYNRPSGKSLYFVSALIAYFVIPSNHGNRPIEFSTWVVVVIAVIMLSGTIHVRFKALLMFILGVFISNFHAGSITACVCVFIALIIVDVYLLLRKETGAQFIKQYALFFLLFVVGTFFCPSGLELYKHMMVNIGTETTEHIKEWAPWTPGFLAGVHIVVLLGGIGYSLCQKGLNRSDLQRISLLLIFYMLTMWKGTKGGTVLIFMTVFFSYPYIKALYDCLFGFLKWGKEDAFLSLLLSAIGFVVLFSEVEQTYFEKMDRIEPDILAVLKEVSQEPDFTIFNDYIAGNYLLYNEIPCFIDSRQTLYTRELSENGAVDDYFELWSAAFDMSVYDKFFNKYDFKYIWESPTVYLKDYLQYRGDYELMIESNDQRLWRRIDMN